MALKKDSSRNSLTVPVNAATKANFEIIKQKMIDQTPGIDPGGPEVIRHALHIVANMYQPPEPRPVSAGNMHRMDPFVGGAPEVFGTISGKITSE